MRVTRDLQIQVPEPMLQAVLNQDKVQEAPHNFYRYPARFSPTFAREAIKAFTKKGDTVIDSFCGGGTSLSACQPLSFQAIGEISG